MKRFLYILAGICFLIGLYSCVEEREERDDPYKDNSFRLKLTIPSPQTRSSFIPSTEEEDEVHELYLLFFEYTPGGTGLFINYCDVSPEMGSPINLNETINIEFESGQGLDKSTTYKVLLVGNISNYLSITAEEWLSTLEGKSENDVIHSALIHIDEGQVLESYRIPMGAEAIKEGNKEILEVELIRMVSRFDVRNYDDENCQLVSASIWNAYPQTHMWENSSNTYSEKRTKRYYGVVSGGENDILGELYAFTNYVAIPEQNDEVTTCLILGFDKGTGTRYYRANINATGVFQQLKRNSAYKINIHKVLGEGEATEEDAYKSKEFVLDLDVNGWTVPDQGNVIIDGDNILVLPTTLIPFTPAAEKRIFNVFAYGEYSVEISQKELPTGMEAHLSHNIGSNTSTLEVSVTASEDPRSGFIEIKFGNLKGIITITQSGSNIDFLTLSAGSIPVFPAIGPASMEGGVEVKSSGSWTAEIFNGNFEFGNGTTIQTGLDGETFSVSTTGSNTNPKIWHSFLLVTLDDNTEIQRVLVLSQNGTGDILISPDPGTLSFDADGLTQAITTFDVTVDNNVEWDITLSGDASKFKYEYDNNQNPTQFTVSAEKNTEDQEYNATLRVRLKNVQTVYKEIRLYQAKHEISAAPANIPSVSYAGGWSEIITVTSTANWEAKINSGEQYASFDGAGGLTVNGDNSNNTFRVYFETNATNQTSRKAEVLLTIPGTNIKKTIEIQQRQGVQKTKLTLFTAKDGPGSLAYEAKYIQQFFNSIHNTNRPVSNVNTYKFGPTNEYVVYRPQEWISTKTGTAGEPYIKAIRTDANIVCWNNATPLRGYLMRGWLFGNETGFYYPGDDIRDRVLLFWGDLEADDMAARFQADANGNHVTNLGYVGKRNVNVPKTTENKLNSELDPATCKILRYLVETGPFGKVEDLESIGFFGHDGTNGGLSSWPATMIPLIKYGNDLVLGIDPKNHIIFCGNTELFHGGQWLPGSNTNANFDQGTSKGRSNQVFLDNMIAWIINVAIYGEFFSMDFID